jgi:phage virion morphogenesis protein
MIQIEWDDSAFRGMLDRLHALAADQQPLMQEIGEHLVETTKQRFDSATAPDGSSWAPNTQTTLERFLGKYKGSHTKTGERSKKGTQRAAGKKPLTGETRSLRTTINYRAGRDHVDIGSPMIYAGVHQFGAAARSFSGGRAPWGDIPARPFLGLSGDDQDWIGERLARALREAAAGSP